MAGYVAPEDCTVAARLRHAGAICLGKLNTIEFASGGMEVFGIARNPWNTAMFPGGSSSAQAQRWQRTWYRSPPAAIPVVPYAPRLVLRYCRAQANLRPH